MTDIMKLARQNQNKDFEIIEQSNVVNLWRKAGARINLIGSLKMGLLAKHRDIDFHIYTPTLDIAQSFGIIANIAQNPQIKRIEFNNLAETEEQCFEWHAFYEGDDEKLWQIDMIQILEGSKFDGYFENIAENIIEAMSDKQQETILKLKFATPDEIKIPGIEYYKAVIQDGITDMTDFIKWREQNKFNGIIEW